MGANAVLLAGVLLELRALVTLPREALGFGGLRVGDWITGIIVLGCLQRVAVSVHQVIVIIIVCVTCHL